MQVKGCRSLQHLHRPLDCGRGLLQGFLLASPPGAGACACTIRVQKGCSKHLDLHSSRSSSRGREEEGNPCRSTLPSVASAPATNGRHWCTHHSRRAGDWRQSLRCRSACTSRVSPSQMWRSGVPRVTNAKSQKTEADFVSVPSAHRCATRRPEVSTCQFPVGLGANPYGRGGISLASSMPLRNWRQMSAREQFLSSGRSVQGDLYAFPGPLKIQVQSF